MAPLRAFLAGLLLLLALPASAQTFPALSGRVVDQANLLSSSQRVDIDSKLKALETRTGRQLVVATVTSLEGLPIQDYGYRLGRAWKIGDEKRDDGVILLVAPNERKVGIETGYGGRVFVTDAMSSVIINEAILPRFKAGDMGGGIVAGTDQIIKLMELSPVEAAKRNAAVTKQVRERGNDGIPVNLIFFGIMLFFFIIPMIRSAAGGRRFRGRRRSGGIDPWVVLWGLDAISRSGRGGGSSWGGGGGDWGGFGGGGGGGFSGGGGSFGGGGASGSW